MRARKLILSCLTIGAFVAYVMFAGKEEVAIVPLPEPSPAPLPPPPIPNPVQPSPLPKPSPKPTPFPTPLPEPIPVPIPRPQGIYKDGTYTGNSADAFYGYIKVEALIQNGKLIDVIFLDYPNDRSNSVRINKYAMPILRSEAIEIQGSKVDIVSGATDSSHAFRESLATALSKAKI